ncbi:uncharacterized protein LOC112516343 [Cynara cardunculus var. scolymus]|uniref:uncharacterized protein LOC112516343 n=1 Tax=Cynara cardunculus var. scolymus TaxID=59895 RepID=UPI000D62F575|nr:uncharacterized protein LOC112516343 [Cynara cardunculus var. scolymus]
MKISSKSILSPGRAAGGGGGRDPPNNLSTSLSRRLRNSGSIKGGASPAMFPTTAKKRGSFENPEPSSPKVTCIGQVRVKTKKKQAKKLRTLSRRHSSGEVSFRKLEHHQESWPAPVTEQRSNQKWVHLPVTICDALRAFGSEFSCLFPCRTEREKEEKMVAAENDRSSCGAVFARWLVAVQDGDGGGERDIELVVEEDDEEEEESFKKPRRHVFEDLEIINDRIEGHKDESRMSICIPPKNALLLMRCRSDPMKMEALTTRSWAPTIDEQLVEDQEPIVDLKESQQDLEMEHRQIMGLVQKDQENEELDDLQQHNQENLQENLQQEVQQDEVVEDQDQREEESMYLGFLFEEVVNQDDEIREHEVDSEMEEALEEEEVEEEEALEEDEEVEEVSTMVTETAEISETHEEEMVNNGVLEGESDVKEEREEVLPECLLMMMYEPKLSMEVSKETWVCSTDFIKRQSNKRKPPPPPLPPPAVKSEGGDESRVSVTVSATTTTDYDLMRVADGGYAPVLQNPARSSCSFPAPPSMAAMLEQKLADAMGYEPFVLTRCKSEPMKTAAAKLLPESCVWENRKSKRLSGVAFGVGAAGLGF